MSYFPSMFTAIVGDPGSGKSTTMQRLIVSLQAKDVQVGGILQPAIYRNNYCIGYNLLNVAINSQIPFATRICAEKSKLDKDSDRDNTLIANGQSLGFSFVENGWSLASEILISAAANCSVIVIDEIGRMEAEGLGHMPALKYLISTQSKKKQNIFVLSVRKDKLAKIESQLQQAISFTISSAAEVSPLCEFICNKLNNPASIIFEEPNI